MSAVTTLPLSRPLTRADLASMPDDGHRYELVDGALIVTPAPSFRHQTISVRLAVLLDSAAPRGLHVLAAPFDVAISDDTVLQPDLLVAPLEAFTEKDLPTAPLLAVEILSPSTRLIDLNLKRARYEAAACPSYWVVDPDGPSLTAWNLVGGRYERVAEVSGEETFHATLPVPMAVTPARLLHHRGDHARGDALTPVRGDA